ncbi:MAG TPA: hypothetical protein VGC34_00120 [Steroidobacteraceae bacterium]
MLRFFGIVILCIAASVVYGLIHDQITIRISPEYFTVLHPQILPKDTSLTGLALAWGVIATWWVGLILGVIVGLASCVGSRPKLSPNALIRPIDYLLLVMTVGAALSGCVGYELGVYQILQPSDLVLANVPADHINRVFAAGAIHLASYALGFVGGIAVAFWAWKERGKRAGGKSPESR